MKAALYARYSSDLQSEASIPDQFRVCERLAADFDIVARFEDRAISAGTSLRPGYQAMLAAARAGTFKIIISEDSSRLWRAMAEQAPRLAELSDLGVHVITQDLDTRQESAGVVGAVMGAMAEAYRKQIAYRTRRGMEGLALTGRSTGGRCYGYGAPEEAAVLREIFALAAHGARPAAIAETLNQRRVPAPRGSWWSLNTVKRILANPRYAGRLIWGATVSQGGARDSRLKRHVMRPDGPLVARQIEPLVEPTLWAACNPRASVG
jgi:site-specific DNA recombinase